MGTIWKGAISFGLVNIPVRVESATKDISPNFRMLDGKDNSPIRTLRVRQVDEKPVDYKELVKGYEYEPGHYVILDDDDFKQVALQVTRTIDIVDFVDEVVIGDVLVLDLMRFADELIPLEYVDTPKEERLTAKEIEMARQLIAQLSTGFEATSYTDEYNEKLLERIRAKIEGRQIAKIEVEEAAEIEVVDLVARLKESIDRAEREREARTEPRAAEGSG
jgi:DNA end-binding protein Ku